MVLSKINPNKTFIEFLFIILPITLLFSVLISEIVVFILITYYLYISDKKDKISTIIDPIIIFLIFVWVYLIINYLINFDKDPSILRTFFFLRFILLVVAINFFINSLKINLDKIFLYWLILVVIICGDLFLQYYTQQNILGFDSIKYDETIFRLGGFMNDELKISGIIYSFGLLVFSYTYFNEKKFKYKNLNYFFLILIIITIFITAERSSFLSSIIFFLFFVVFTNFKKTSLKFFLLSLFIIITFFGFFQKDLSSRMIFKISENIKLFKFEKNKNYLNKDSHYFAHWSTAYQIYKDNKLFGVGVKNFRNFCDNDRYNKNVFPDWQNKKCSTHPHNFYFEIISETGVIGFLIIVSFFIYSFIKFYKVLRLKKDNFFLFNSFIILIYFTPFLPRGSFFTNWNAIIFWIIFGFLYSNYFRLTRPND